MNQSNFQKLCENIVLLDGASGTFMHQNNMPAGDCPEIFALENKDIVIDMQKQYFESGANMVYTFTFGANYPKLSKYNIPRERVYEINKDLAKISASVRDSMKIKNPDKIFLIAGDIAPTGEFLEPMGNISYDELKSVYKEQARGLFEGGVDLFVIETMMDLAQTKIAVLAIKEVCDLPIMVTMTFEGNKTLSGNSPKECLITLQNLGISAFGANCSSGPEQMAETLKGLYKISQIPLIAKPNAGMPVNINNETVFPMGAIEFAEKSEKFLENNIKLLGGCCGTTPEHIKMLSKKIESKRDYIKKLNFKTDVNEASNMICSQRMSLEISKSVKYETVKIKNKNDAQSIADLILDATLDEPDFVVIDFIEFEKDSDYGSEILEEIFKDINMQIFIPIGLKSNKTKTLNEAYEIYTGRLAFLPDENTNDSILLRAKHLKMKIV